MTKKMLDFYHSKEESDELKLSKDELYDLHADEEDYKNQKEYRDASLDTWRWAGSVFNVLQNAQPDDRLSQITIGWIRSYIDTGIAQMTAGEPEFSFEALGPSDEARTVLWKSLTESVMSRCNFMSHQRIAMTDAHIFGPGVFEVYQQRPYRTIREPQKDGTFKDRVVIDHRIPRVGVRAISPFRCTRNPNVSDPNEVGSCTKEEILSWDQFVQKYGRCWDSEGNDKYKHIHELTKGTHVKITIYQNEIRDVYRIYANTYGGKVDGAPEDPPEGLGVPIFDRPIKIHDIYDKKGILERSIGLNIPGMCNLVFMPYADKLNDGYETHDIYGMGLPQHMEGLDTFMQTAFNMTIDNWRMGNTVVLDIESRDGTLPDFDANTYYGGEYVNAKVTPQTLGQDRTVNFDNMYDVLQKLSIPATGININMIDGEPSRTKFEFEQRIAASNQRAETRLKEWESGPLKRLGTLLLSAAISELTVHDLENIREGDAQKVLADIEKGRATRDDFEFKGGKPVQRKLRYYIDMKGIKENFTPKRKSRMLSVDSTENTLVKDKKNPDAIHKIPITEEYVVPDWYVESGILFDTKVDSKRMITNKKIKDGDGLKSLLNNLMMVAQLDPTVVQQVDLVKILKEDMDLAGMGYDNMMKQQGESETGNLQEQIKKAKEQIIAQSSPPPPNAQAQQGQPVPQGAYSPQLAAVGSGQGSLANVQQGAAGGTL